jgi:hypothetical protein
MTDNKEESEEKWEGFRPAAHFLNTQRVLGLRLTKVERTSAGEKVETHITIRDAFDTVCTQKITKIGWPKEGWPLLLTQVTTEAGEYVFDGPPFNRALLELLLELRQDGINAFAATWFWYDTSSCMDEPHDAYDFFIVYDNKIVRERVSFSKFYESGFDPSIFTAADGSEPTWSDEKEWEEARVRFWYRKFYQETERGQLMVLRPDEPKLHHFPEGRLTPDSGLGLLQEQLARTHSMLESALGLLQRELTETHGVIRWMFFLLVALVVAIVLARK